MTTVSHSPEKVRNLADYFAVMQNFLPPEQGLQMMEQC
jgi:hypothetical protein